MKNYKGKFITVEGGEGSGKTTVIQRLKEYLSDKSLDFIVTREPGGIEIAEQIRNVILDTRNTSMDARTEALLYAASRRQHMAERVIPALNEGKIVICDRFIDSSLVYQGHARGIGMDKVMAINEFAIEGYMPDVTLYLDIDPESGLKRIHKNEDREVNRLDLEAMDFHYKVREGYMKLMEQFPERIRKIDASGNCDEVFEAVRTAIDSIIGTEQ